MTPAEDAVRSTAYGTLTDYATGEPIRPATREELARTEAKLASGDSDAYTGAWAGVGGRAVYVDA